MRTNAIAVANYLIDRSVEKGYPLSILPLLKMVYFVHGFSLALLNRGALDPRFDKVEAWKFGPVIPSVYHTFKHNGAKPIETLGNILQPDGAYSFEDITPKLKDEHIIEVSNAVLSRYGDVPPMKLVEITHEKGTPWARAYRVGLNKEITDKETKQYYDILVDVIVNKS